MIEKIQRFLKLAETSLADSLVEELSPGGKCSACYDAAAYCALAVAAAKGKELREIEWSQVLSYLAESGISPEVVHSVTTLSRIYGDWYQSRERADVGTARMCAIQIQKAVAAWFLQAEKL